MSTWDACLIVTLKLPQIHIEPSCLTTGTIGEAHFENFTDDMTLDATSLSNSALTFSFNTNGTGPGLKNLGQALLFTLSCILAPLRQPNCSVKTLEYLFRASFNALVNLD